LHGSRSRCACRIKCARPLRAQILVKQDFADIHAGGAGTSSKQNDFPNSAFKSSFIDLKHIKVSFDQLADWKFYYVWQG